jgi:hypothetical protein
LVKQFDINGGDLWAIPSRALKGPSMTTSSNSATRPTIDRRTIFAIQAALIGLVACGSDEATFRSADGAGVPTASGEPLYAVTTQIIGEDFTSYLVPVSSLAAGAEANLDTAIEFAGRAVGVGPSRGGVVHVATDQSPVLARYVAQGNGFALESELSFAGYGVTGLLAFSEQFVFAGADKAYFIDDDSDQIIIWNPSQMTLTRSIDLTPFARDGLGMTTGLTPRLWQGHLVFALSYFQEEEERYSQEATIVFVDTESDEIAAAVTDTRCSYLAASMQSTDGDLYLGSSAYTAAVRAVLGDQYGGPSCVLRVNAGSRVTDPGFSLDLVELAGGPAGDLVAGAGNRAFTRVLDPALAPATLPLTPGELSSPAYWRWAEIADITDRGTTLAMLSALEPGPSSSLSYVVDDRTLASQSSADYSSTTLIDLAAEGGPSLGLEVRGIPFSVLRVR